MRVEAPAAADHVWSAMPAVIHRLLTLCLVLTLLVGAPGRSIACGMAKMAVGIAADMADGCPAAKAACADHRPSCADHLGCIAVTGIPAAPVLLEIAFEWTPPAYERASTALSGISIEPELSPPILAA